MRRLFTAAVLATGLALTLSACSSNPTATGTASTGNAMDTLIHSADAFSTTQSHQVATIDTPVGNSVTEADSDPAAKTTALKITGGRESEIRAIGNDVWVTSTEEGAKPWLHLDQTKLSAQSPIKDELDLKSNFAVLAGLTEAKEVSPNHFQGTIDLAKAKAAATSEGEKDELQALIELAGAKANAIALTATLDDQHRLVELNYSVASTVSGATSATKVLVTNIGKAIAVAKPATGDVLEATADMYAGF